MSKTDLGYDSEKLGGPPAFAPASSSTSRIEEDPTLLEAEETLHRGLKARQISMIALGGAVGTGLIIGSGTALRRGGPLGMLLGYSFVGFVCYLVMCALGEMAAYLPHKKGFSGYASRFVDPALGFALGWNYLFKYLIVTPNNLSAAGIVIRYWDTHAKVHIAVWMTIFIVLVFLINLLGIRFFGELEFWMSSIKVLALIGLILFGLICDLGGNPRHDRVGFRYWDNPGVFSYYLKEGALGRFLGVWSVMTNALFAYMGTELIGVTVGEAENPRKNIPRAIRRTFWRILIFYVGGVFVIGLIVPSNDPNLFTATKAKTGAAASPFVVAAKNFAIRGLDHVINSAILLFVLSAANSDLYIGSRTLYALAAEGKAPAIFKRVNRMGVPYPALIFCTAFCCLVYLNVQATSAQVFNYFVSLVTFFGATTWTLEVQSIPRSSLPYRAPFQPYGSYFALVITGIITFFKGFDTFMPWNHKTFITSYIGAPVFFALWLGYKLVYRTRVLPPAEVDLVSGKRQIDEEEQMYLAKQEARGPRTRWQKIWDSL
ncbi:hypothetical protein FS837_012161 [Tulasnella sp. UAMH 9824]|nr:hypothetical protein FS837_012161 [Tulasnella sp. UAMH 9824]